MPTDAAHPPESALSGSTLSASSTDGPSAPVRARDRVRAELTNEIKTAARRHVQEEGAAALSMRAIARELGMASSAIYRYYASRDALLTALIIDAYNSLGAACEQANATIEPADFTGRFRAIGHAARNWAAADPHQFNLIYGSPIPGYAAPQDTIGPATRVSALLVGILADIDWTTADPDQFPPAPEPVRADLEVLRETGAPAVPTGAWMAGVLAWTQIFGLISFELNGQYENLITDRLAFFDHALTTLTDGLLP